MLKAIKIESHQLASWVWENVQVRYAKFALIIWNMTDFDKKSLKNYDVWYYMSVQVINRLTHNIINEQDAMVSMDTNNTREAIQGFSFVIILKII